MTSPFLPYWLAANYLHRVGPRQFLNWYQHFSDMAALIEASKDVQKSLGISDAVINGLTQTNTKLINADITWAHQVGHTIICYDDPRYPALLKELPDPPLLLYVRGNSALLSSPQLAIVGSRHATVSGLKEAEHFAEYLAAAGLTITSGLALGIDGASHRGAMVSGGKTIGVAGTGLNVLYPKSHHALFAEILEKEGAIISEFPLNTPPLACNFPRRNRIISGLSIGVLVIEAALKSGSLITARFALEQGREVFAIPGSIHQPLARGCHHLIREGAMLVETVEDILSQLQLPKSNPNIIVSKEKENLAAEEHDLLEKIDYEITPSDVIILRSTLTTSEVSYILLALELKGYIQSVPGGYIRIA